MLTTGFTNTLLTVQVGTIVNDNVGLLKAIVTVNGIRSAAAFVATVIPVSPIVQFGSSKLSRAATGNRVHIRGLHFGVDVSLLQVNITVSNGLAFQHVGLFSPASCHDTILSVDLPDSSTMEEKELYAIAIHSIHGRSAATELGYGVRIAQFSNQHTEIPSVLATTYSVLSSVTLMSITGLNLNTLPTPGDEIVVDLTTQHGLPPIAEVVGDQVDHTNRRLLSSTIHSCRHPSGSCVDLYGSGGGATQAELDSCITWSTSGGGWYTDLFKTCLTPVAGTAMTAGTIRNGASVGDTTHVVFDAVSRTATGGSACGSWVCGLVSEAAFFLSDTPHGVQFTYAQYGFKVGLSSGDASGAPVDVDYGFMFSSQGWIISDPSRTWPSSGEAGWYQDTGPASVYQVRVNGMGSVEYVANGVVLYTSTNSPTFPMAIDVALEATGSSVSNLTWVDNAGGIVDTTVGAVSRPLTIRVLGLSDENAGWLKARVSVRGVKSQASQISTIIPVKPVIGAQCEAISNDASSICDSNGDGIYEDPCIVGALCAGSPSGFVTSTSSYPPGDGILVASNRETGGEALFKWSESTVYRHWGQSFTIPAGSSVAVESLTLYISAQVALQASFDLCTITFVSMASATAVTTGSGIATLEGRMPNFVAGNQFLTFKFASALNLLPGSYAFLIEFNEWRVSQVLQLARSSSAGAYADGLALYKDSADGAVWKAPPGALGDLGFYLRGENLAGPTNGGCGSAGVCASLKPMAISTNGNRIEIAGFRFGTDASALTVTFTPAISYTSVIYARDNLMIVDTGSTSSLSVSSVVHASVFRKNHGTSTSVAVATVSAALSALPTLIVSNSSIAHYALSLTLAGTNLGSQLTDVKVYFLASAGVNPLARVTQVAGGSTLSLLFGHDNLNMVVAALNGQNDGVLRAVVTVQGVKSAITQVGIVTMLSPIVTPKSFALAKSSAGTIIEIQGSQFRGVTNDITVRLIPDLVLGNSGHPTYCTDSLMTLEIPDTSSSLWSGGIYANVSHIIHGQFGAFIQVAKLFEAQKMHTVQQNLIGLGSSAHQLYIYGSFFGYPLSEVRVYFHTETGAAQQSGVLASVSNVLPSQTCRNLGLRSGGGPQVYGWEKRGSGYVWFPFNAGTWGSTLTSLVACTETDTSFQISTNAVPDSKVGKFPMSADTTGNGLADNPNSILEQNIQLTIPKYPKAKAFNQNSVIYKRDELPLGPIGVALNGVPFYSPYNTAGQDTADPTSPVYKVNDLCNGQVDTQGQYQYHSIHQGSNCLGVDSAGRHSLKLGYALDGFPIYGPFSDGGIIPIDLDICNGRIHPTLGYVYHVTGDKPPYILGCFHGEICQDNACPVGSSAALSNSTKIVTTITGLSDAHRGVLNAIVTIRGVKSSQTQVATVLPVQPIVGSTCAAITSPSSSCDVDGDGVYSELCALDVLCDPSSGNNGGCGVADSCKGSLFKVAKSLGGNRVEIHGKRFGASKQLLVTESLTLPQSIQSTVGKSQGYYFTAPKSVILTGLHVLDDNAGSPQYLQVVKLPSNFHFLTAAQKSASTWTLLFSGADIAGDFYTGMSISVSQNDVIAVFGYRGSRKSSSCGSGPYMTSMGGEPVVLHSMSTSQSIPFSSSGTFSVGTTIGLIGLRLSLPSSVVTSELSVLFNPVAVQVFPNCALLCSAVLHCVSLCFAVLHCALLCFILLYCALLCFTAFLCFAVLHCALLYFAVLHCALLCFTVLCCSGGKCN